MVKEDYVAKITSATPAGLVIINYELALDFIKSGTDAHKAGDMPAFETHIAKAREFVLLLMKSLDLSYDVSRMLFKSYVHIDSLLAKSCFSKNMETLDEASQTLNAMLSDWTEILNTETAQPVMENAQQLYAGLTYKNGELAEYVPESENRGYKA